MTPTSKQTALVAYLIPMIGLVIGAAVAARPALERSQLRIENTEQQRQQTADVEAQK